MESGLYLSEVELILRLAKFSKGGNLLPLQVLILPVSKGKLSKL